MVSLKNGVLKVMYNSEDVAKRIFDICFVMNVVTIFAFYKVQFIAPAMSFLLLASSLFIWTVRKKSKVIIPYNTVWYLAVIVYAGLSSLWTSYITTSFIGYLLKLVVVLAIITSISIYVDTFEDLERIISLFVFSMVIIAILEFSSVQTSKWFDGAMGSNFSGCNPNEIAFWSACAQMISFYKYYIQRQKSYIILVVFFLMFVLMSSSRKAMAAVLIVPLVIILLSTFKKNYFLKILLMIAIIVLIIYFVMTNELAYNAIGRRFNSMLNYYSTGTQRSDNSLYMRNYYIEIAKKMFSESPIFGKGLENFSKILDLDLGGKVTYSHNNHWQMLSEFGIIGFVIYYSFYVFCTIKLARDIFVKKSRVSILFLSMIIVIFVLEYGMVTYNSKTTQLVLAMAYTSTYVGEDDGRRYRYLSNNKNNLET